MRTDSSFPDRRAPLPSARPSPAAVGRLSLPVPWTSERVGQPAERPNWLESGAALALLVLAAPLLFALALFVLLVDGRPMLYHGERLGRGKRPFTMHKLRTLRRGSENALDSRLHSARDGLEIRGGRLLRESRLDELPQLWNIVRGDMRFVGPRPERHRVYWEQCRGIPGYARRFAVRPGLMGVSQLFTPHATPKRIRAWLDNTWSRGVHSSTEVVGLTAFTAMVVARRGLQHALGHVRDLWRNQVLHQRRERRRLRRVRPRATVATLRIDGRELRTRVLDMNEVALCVRSPAALACGQRGEVRLELEIPGGHERRPVRSASGTVVVRTARARDGLPELVLDFEPVGARSTYVLHQYLLSNSLARPRRRGR